MKKDCEVVRDLMPLVLDDVASDGSKHMVSAHVQTCAECAAYMNQLKADLPAGKKSELDSRAAFDAAAQTLRKQKRRRTLRNILLGALIVCILGLANLYCFDWLMNKNAPDSDERVRDSAVPAGGRQACHIVRLSRKHDPTLRQAAAGDGDGS